MSQIDKASSVEASSNRRQVGELGEGIACKFLVKHGHKIKDRNYRKKWGEIDIISEKDNIIHFVEVKSVSREILPTTVNHETNEYRPEDNIHPWKIKKIHRTIQTYLLDKKISDETDWQVDIIAVFLSIKDRKAKIRVTENIIL